METEEKQLELYNSLMKYRDKRSQVLPDVAAAGNALGEAVYSDGALNRKVKRLIAMAVALGIGCMPCIIAQTKQAVEAGATKEEVLEAASVLLAIHGTSGYSESWRVVKVLEELGMM
ncbi:MAG: carboxymuconolactone decarboxylase family protein [Chloroflexi bacterium]|nr:carboxymuconolactone decarboxylase family protein [Chloroflexota bacterium]